MRRAAVVLEEVCPGGLLSAYGVGKEKKDGDGLESVVPGRRCNASARPQTAHVE